MIVIVKRRILAISIVFLMIFSLLPMTAPTVYAAPPTSLKVGTHTVGTAGDDTTGWNFTSSSGWRYDQSLDWLVLLDYANNQNITATGGLSIATAGLNEAGQINVTGDLTITGSGILIAEGLTCSGVMTLDGPAVFLKDVSGKYILQNNGYLDDWYSLPAGKEFVVPTGKTLTLETIDFGSQVDASQRFSTARLNIPSNSNLTVESGGKVVVDSFFEVTGGGYYTFKPSELYIDGTLNVKDGGVVENKGKIYLNAQGMIECNNTGRINCSNPYQFGESLLLSEASSAFNIRTSGAAISVLQGPGTANTQIADRKLILAGKNNIDLPQINNTDRAFYLKSIELEGNSELSVHVLGQSNVFSLTIDDGITGTGTFNVVSGIVNVSGYGIDVTDLKVSGGVLNVNKSGGGDAIKATGSIDIENATVNSTRGNWSQPINIKGSLIYADPAVIPTVTTDAVINAPATPAGVYKREGGAGSSAVLAQLLFSGLRFTLQEPLSGLSSGGAISFDDIVQYAETATSVGKSLIVEVSGLDSAGNVFAVFLDQGDIWPPSMTTVTSISVLCVGITSGTIGGGGEATALSSYTGKGVLGAVTKPPAKPSTGSSGGGAGSGAALCASGSHSFTTWSVVTAATCGKAGSQKSSCSRGCGTSSTKEIPATGQHTFSAWTANGNIETRTCSVCAKAETRPLAIPEQAAPLPQMLTGEVTSTVTDGRAIATVPEDVVKDMTDKLGSPEGTLGIQINVTSPEDVSSVSLDLPTGLIAAAAAAGTGITVNTGLGTVTIDTGTLADMAKDAGANEPVTVTVSKPQNMTEEQRGVIGDSSAYEFTITRGGKTYDQFKGKVTVALNHELKPGQHYSGVVIKHIGADGKATVMTHKYRDGKYIFDTNHFSVFAVFYDESLVWINPFTDVSDDDWFFETVKYVHKENIFSGTSETKFSPGEPMTRAMFATVLYKLAGTPDISKDGITFEDVSGESWYSDAVSWAAEAKVALGDGKGNFNPNGRITREQIVTMFYNYAKYADLDVTKADMSALDKFPDNERISGYAALPMAWAVSNGIMSGDGKGYLLPKDNSLRSHVAQIIQNFRTKI